jgi:enolase-phosphatase E1
MTSRHASRATSEPAAAPFRCAAIVTDIEGTTGSIAFVRDVLFPYAKEHLADFVAHRRGDPAVAQALRETAQAAHEPEASEARLISLLGSWIDEDRKITPLKTLQGLIWAEGYASEILFGHVYPDAAAGLRRWHAAGIPLYVYSSGSIAAQKLLFGHSTAGDLTPLFRGYFDTTSGAKTDPFAYRRIAESIALSPPDLLFLSDREAELEAAHQAGWQVACVARPADMPPETTSTFPTFRSFDQIGIERHRSSLVP